MHEIAVGSPPVYGAGRPTIAYAETVGADLVFAERQVGSSHYWSGRLLQRKVWDFADHDRPYQREVREAIALVEATRDTDGPVWHAKVTMRGNGRGSTRYATFTGIDQADAVTQAQAHLLKWAARRFRYEVEL